MVSFITMSRPLCLKVSREVAPGWPGTPVRCSNERSPGIQRLRLAASSNSAMTRSRDRWISMLTVYFMSLPSMRAVEPGRQPGRELGEGPHQGEREQLQGDERHDATIQVRRGHRWRGHPAQV